MKSGRSASPWLVSHDSTCHRCAVGVRRIDPLSPGTASFLLLGGAPFHSTVETFNHRLCARVHALVCISSTETSSSPPWTTRLLWEKGKRGVRAGVHIASCVSAVDERRAKGSRRREKHSMIKHSKKAPLSPPKEKELGEKRMTQ